MSDKCNDSLYVKPIEVCSINSLNYLTRKTNDNKYVWTDTSKVFDSNIIKSNTDLNYEFRSNNNEYKYEKKIELKDLCEPTKITNEYYINCVLHTQNPLFTYKDGYCIIPNVLDIPQFKNIEEKKDTILKLDKNKSKDEEGNFKYSRINNNKYCEDRWFDWIVIPNYHLGNRVLKDSGEYSREDVKICYKNCNAGELPYINSSGSNLCVPKEIAYEGKYEKKLDYSPLALINIIGNNKLYLYNIFVSLYCYKLQDKLSNYDINIGNIFNVDFKDADNYIIDEVYNEIKNVLNIIVNDDILDIPDYSTEYKYLTYKNPYLEETDLTTILGMDKNDILSNDVILIHTVYLAYKYKVFLENLSNFTDEEFEKGNKIQEYSIHFFNINNNLKDFDIKSNVDENNTKKIRQRLANILYKSINICYDNKTDFSKNLIKRTNSALDNITKIQGYIDNIKYKGYEKIIIDTKYIADIIVLKNDIKQTLNENFNIKYYKHEENRFNKLTNDKYKNYIINNYIFFTEEDSEIINGNICKSGEFSQGNKCVKCNEECISIDKCENNNNCKIYCNNDCDKIKTKPSTTICGGTIDDNTEQYKKEPKTNIKTPIDDETIIPDFTNIFKTAIRIFFIIIVIYIAYMFYKMFNETILTFANKFWGFFEWFWYYIIIRNNVKMAEHYENNIRDKYNIVIRKTMT